MISFLQAQEILRKHAPLLPTEKLTLQQAHQRVSAATVFSRETLPAFDNSAMDGFAVLASETGAGVTLTIAGTTYAGAEGFFGERQLGSAWRIMTGAVLPAGYDAVVPIEKVQCYANGLTIELTGAINAGEHVRRRGEDVQFQQAVVEAGRLLNAAAIMALAATGHDTVMVRRRAKIFVFATGNELVDCADVALQAAQIRNSNSPFLLAGLREQYCDAEYRGVLPDQPESFAQHLQDALLSNPDLILTTGAVSAGDLDFIPRIVQELGGEILFHKVAIKPGKPILFARFGNGSLMLGLPGNPMSTAIGFRFFVMPLLRAMQGLPEPKKPRAVLSGALSKKTPLREFRKAHMWLDDGQWRVAELEGQESHRIASLLHSNAWLVVPENDTNISDGQLVEVTGLLHDNFV